MAVDDPFESRLTGALHRLLDAETGPHPRWADAPAAFRVAGVGDAIGGGEGREERRGERRGGRVTLLLLAAALAVAIMGGTVLVGGRLPGWLRLNLGPSPTPHSFVVMCVAAQSLVTARQGVADAADQADLGDRDGAQRRASQAAVAAGEAWDQLDSLRGDPASPGPVVQGNTWQALETAYVQVSQGANALLNPDPSDDPLARQDLLSVASALREASEGLPARCFASQSSPAPSATMVTPTVTRSPAPAATSPTSSSPAAGCASSVTLAGTATTPVTIGDVRVGTHPGYDRIVFDITDSALRPRVTIAPAQPPFTMDASGQVVYVSGASYLRITLHDAAGPNLTEKTYEQRPGYPILTELRNTGDFEGVQTWIAGLTGPACVRISTLSSPNRVVVDLLTP